MSKKDNLSLQLHDSLLIYSFLRKIQQLTILFHKVYSLFSEPRYKYNQLYFLVFNDLNLKFFFGETRMPNEIFQLNNLHLYRTPLQSHCAWAVYGE